MDNKKENTPPSILRLGVSIAASAGLTGMLCCVAPMLLFMLGVMSGTYAISFADFFYQEDGSAGVGAWLLRFIAVTMGLGGVLYYRGRQQQCTIDPREQQKNLVALMFVITTLGVGTFLSLEALSSWYFDMYIVPAQQEEMGY